MIVFIEGILEKITNSSLILSTHGLGYEVYVPTSVLQKFDQIGTRYKLYTLAIYREDSQVLYGFIEPQEREFFRLMVEKVGGLGPKLALAVMNHFSVDELLTILASSDAERLATCSGIGKKTSQRMVLELKDCLKKQGKWVVDTGSTAASRLVDKQIYEDTLGALIALGYAKKQAEKTLNGLLTHLPLSEMSVESLLKKALALKK